MDWEIEHDYEPDVIGYIREGVADLEVIEELETIRTIGEMLGDFDDQEIGEENFLVELSESEASEEPRLLKFPGLE